MNNVEIMTQAGYDKLKQKLISASADRDEALSAIAESKKQGGELSENSEFIEAKDRFDKIEIRMKSINDRLMSAKIMDINTIIEGGKIRFGSHVKLVDLDNENELHYQILGEEEADIKNGIISYKSPIAKAMIGKEVGDQVYFVTPSGERELEVLKIGLD